MRILVTGAEGFIGKNLIWELQYLDGYEVYSYDLGMEKKKLEEACRICEFVFHLAGVNRPKNSEEFYQGNLEFTAELIDLLERYQNTCPIMISSSIQAECDNIYGISKKKAEELVREYGKRAGVKTIIYRFSNVFGKWTKPNYNSVIATFCYNIARGIPIQINKKETELHLIYIDDLIDELIRALHGEENVDKEGIGRVKLEYRITLGEIADMIYTFRNSREKRQIPNMTSDSLSKKLYSTYLSFLPKNEFSYPLEMHIDDRGSFTEVFRTPDRGQISVNKSKPGMEKGNHWHHTKNEKFLVVSGMALVQFRKPDSTEIISYHVSGERLEIIDIPCGYVHNIINEGKEELVTLMWCNECFDVNRPDTYPLKVNEERK